MDRETKVVEMRARWAYGMKNEVVGTLREEEKGPCGMKIETVGCQKERKDGEDKMEHLCDSDIKIARVEGGSGTG